MERRSNESQVKTTSYQTPDWLWDKINSLYNIQTDACTFPTNPLKTPVFFTEINDGLDHRKWSGNVYINPPYYQYDIQKWIGQAKLYTLFNPERSVVMLLPAKTEQLWFHDLLLDKKSKIVFLKKRLTFANMKDSARFSSILLLFNDKNFEGKLITDSYFDK